LHPRHSDLALSGLTKAYGSSVAVDNVTLRIAAGEMVALLGPSGCGKTTTLRMIAGLVRPDAGEILIGGERITGLPVHRRNIGLVFQNYALFPHLTVGQNVRFGLEMRHVRKHEAARRVQEALELVQLGGFADRLPSALSGGQQQRVALARALVIEPSVLLLDEPLGALDRSLRENMQVELRQLQERLGITTVIVTHDQEEAMTLADRVVVMRGGRIEQIGTPQEVYRTPVSRFVAGFIGAANFLRGRLAGHAGGLAEIEAEGGLRLAVPAQADVAREVLVALRPEAITLHPPGTDATDAAAPNSVAATIEQAIFNGLLTRVHLRLDNGAALLALHQGRDSAAIALAAGTRVRARWEAADGHIVSDT
jgi:spermidine/putrescine ABC transporter ATP-binding subunit